MQLLRLLAPLERGLLLNSYHAGNIQGQPSMHDNLRLQRLVQHLASLVEAFVQASEEEQTDSTAPEKVSLIHEGHQEIMGIAQAVFKEMSLQVDLLLCLPSASLPFIAIT